MPLQTWLRSTVLFLVLGACAHVDELTADEHRNAAVREAAKAHQERDAYEPGPRTAPRGPLTSSLSSDLWVHDSAEQHLLAADAHQRLAHEHLEAAQRLEDFEDAACRGLSKAERSACPLITSSLERVEGVERGVRLVLKASAPTEQLVAQMRCHLAFSRAQGFDRPTCPLYFKGVELEARAGSIDVVSADAAVAARIRAEALVMFGH